MRKLQRSLLASAAALVIAGPGNGRRAIFERLFLRRQPDRRRFLQARAAARHGSVHDESRPDLGAGIRCELRVRRDAREPGRHRLCARRRARHAACRASRRSPPTGSAVPIATQITQFLASRSAESEGVLRRLGRRERHLLSTRPRAERARPRPHKCRPPSGSPRSSSLPRSRALQAGGARYITVFNLPDIGRTPCGVASGQRRIDQRALVALQHDLHRRARCRAASRRCASTRSRFFNEVLANPAAVRIREHDDARVRRSRRRSFARPRTSSRRRAAQTFVFADGVHPTTAGHALIAQTRAIDDHRPAADGRAGRSSARGRAGELPRARQPHVVEPQRAARRRASSRRGPRTTTAARTCRRARPTAADT